MSSPKQAWNNSSLDVLSTNSPSLSPSPSATVGSPVTRSASRSIVQSLMKSGSPTTRSRSKSPAKYPQEQQQTPTSPVQNAVVAARSPTRITPKQDGVDSLSVPPPLSLPSVNDASPHLSPVVDINQVETRPPSNSWFANMANKFHKKKEDAPPPATKTAAGADTYRTMLRQEYQPENDAIPFHETFNTRTQNEIIVYDYTSQIDEIVRHGEQYYGGFQPVQMYEGPKTARQLDTASNVVMPPPAPRDNTKHAQKRDRSPSRSHSHKGTRDRTPSQRSREGTHESRDRTPSQRSRKGTRESRDHSRSRSHKEPRSPSHKASLNPSSSHKSSHDRSSSNKTSHDRSSSPKSSHDEQRVKYQAKTRGTSLEPPPKYVDVDLSSSPKAAWAQTDISQAPPLTMRPRGAPMDPKNRRVIKAVLPASQNTSTTTTPSTSPPTSKISSPVISTMSSPVSSAPVSPRMNRRGSVASMDGEMNDYYDEVFDDVFASDEDEYEEDMDVCDDVTAMDISDDPQAEWENEDFALAEAKAHQVLQSKKKQQERDLQQHRQEEYQPATVWLEPVQV